MSEFVGIKKNELYHHGILGMKWGVRRYQNYDGSYTKRGLERYQKAESAYNETKDKLKSAKTEKDKSKIQSARGDLKRAKRELNTSYDKLKRDHMADEGKKLYQKGETISGNQEIAEIAKAVTAIAGAATGAIIVKQIRDEWNFPLDSVNPASISAGIAIANGVIYLKNRDHAKKLRAYYAH